MFAMTATTPAGVLAKLRIARKATGEDGLWYVFDCPAPEYLDNAIANFERLS
jgi:hypothetical protein